MELNLGRLGATRQTWKPSDVRNLIMSLIDEHPKASEERLRKLFLEKIREDDDYLIAAADYAFTNNFRALERQRINDPRAPIAALMKQREETSEVETIKSQISQLNLEQSNGKRLRWCTREEIMKFGSGYQRMAKKMKPGQLVGQAFNEQQVRAFLKV